MSTENQKTLPLLSLRNLVLFPGAVMPVEIGRASSLRLIEALGGKGARVLVGTQKDADIEGAGRAPTSTRSASRVKSVRIVKAAENRVTAVLRGMERRPRRRASRRRSPTSSPPTNRWSRFARTPIEIDGLGMAVYDVAKQLIAISPDIPDETAQVLDQNKDPGRLGDIVAATVDLSPDERASLLVESDVAERLRRLLVLLQRKVELIKVKQKIDLQVREEFSKHQREAVLRQKLKAIQDELGEGETRATSTHSTRRSRRPRCRPTSRRRPASSSSASSRWRSLRPNTRSSARTSSGWWSCPGRSGPKIGLDLDQAREILDADHYDLKKVKKRILEYLAVRKLAPGKEGSDPLPGRPARRRQDVRSGKSIRALAGPRVHPRVAGRRARRGRSPRPPPHVHRRAAGTCHPGHAPGGHPQSGVHARRDRQAGRDFRGDPSAALLEVLDPEQNSTFSDHYLEVNFDLSDVIFIATANMLDPIPPALLDRMEGARDPGYTAEEKLEIAKRHLVPKQIAEHGLDDEKIRFSDETLTTLIEQYTREAGRS
jgi:ATP-dependent Lon protease